jgi:ketosteroid isomerase-like protein
MTLSVEQLQSVVLDLKDRQDIRDCLSRYARGVDRFDRELLLSAYHPDAVDDHGKFLGGPEEFWDWAFNQHSKVHLSHQHVLGTHSCDVSGDTAHAETYYMFVSMNREGPAMSMTGGRYIDRLEKRQGEWKIAYRICTRDWAMMEERPDFDDLSTFTSTRHLLSAEVRSFMNAGFAPHRDSSDASYRRPLLPDPARQEEWDRLER